MAGDGLCYTQVILANDAMSGHASSTEFGQAGFTMFQECVIKYGYGGVVTKIGEPYGYDDVNLTVYMMLISEPQVAITISRL